MMKLSAFGGVDFPEGLISKDVLEVSLDTSCYALRAITVEL
jgi:hypothetical protein